MLKCLQTQQSTVALASTRKPEWFQSFSTEYFTSSSRGCSSDDRVLMSWMFSLHKLWSYIFVQPQSLIWKDIQETALLIEWNVGWLFAYSLFPPLCLFTADSFGYWLSWKEFYTETRFKKKKRDRKKPQIWKYHQNRHYSCHILL